MNVIKYPFFTLVLVATISAAKEDAVQLCKDKKTIQAIFETAKNNNKIVVIDFFAEWCGPCKMMAPTFERLAKELKETCIFAKVDVDQSTAMALEYNIQGMPTIIVLRNKKEIGRILGSKTYTVLKAEIESCVKKSY